MIENIADKSVRISPLDTGFVLEGGGKQQAVETWPNLVEKLRGLFGINGNIPLEYSSSPVPQESKVEPVRVAGNDFVLQEAKHFDPHGLPSVSIGIFKVLARDGVYRISRQKKGSLVWLKQEDLEYLKLHPGELDETLLTLSAGKQGLLRSFIRHADLSKLEEVKDTKERRETPEPTPIPITIQENPIPVRPGFEVREAEPFEYRGLPFKELGSFQVRSLDDVILISHSKKGMLWLKMEDFEYLKAHPEELENAARNLSGRKKAFLCSAMKLLEAESQGQPGGPAPSIDREGQGKVTPGQDQDKDLDADYKPILNTDTRPPGRNDDYGKIEHLL